MSSGETGNTATSDAAADVDAEAASLRKVDGLLSELKQLLRFQIYLSLVG